MTAERAEPRLLNGLCNVVEEVEALLLVAAEAATGHPGGYLDLYDRIDLARACGLVSAEDVEAYRECLRVRLGGLLPDHHGPVTDRHLAEAAERLSDVRDAITGRLAQRAAERL